MTHPAEALAQQCRDILADADPDDALTALLVLISENIDDSAECGCELMSTFQLVVETLAELLGMEFTMHPAEDDVGQLDRRVTH